MGVEHVSLCRCRVLYLGSAIPLETAVGIESIQGPCRDRYDNVDSSQKAAGIDSILSVYSSGLMLQYAADSSSSTWFPMQTLHVCAAVKAVSGAGALRFVSLDTAAAQRSTNPPMFACIMRRTKGIKVLECHVFICKSNQAAMALVQSCTHAFGHKEGWMNSMPSTGTRIVSAEDKYKGGKSVRGGGFYSDRSDLVQKFDVSCRVDDAAKAPAQPTLAIVAANNGGCSAADSCSCSCRKKTACKCSQAPAPAQPQPQQPVMMPMMMPGAPMMQGGMMGNYFADWNSCGGQPLMIIPNSPFYPGEEEMSKKKRKKKKAKKTTKVSVSDEEEEETYFVRKSDLANHQGDSLRARMRKVPGGDSLRSRLRGHHHGGVTVEEILLPPKPCPPPQPPIILAPQPKPCPPQIVLIPQPQPPAPQPSFKNQQNPKTDVVVYAPQVITANRKEASFNYDDRDNEVVDYRPDNRGYWKNSERTLNDGRQDNRVDYRSGYYRTDDYRADQRRFDSRQDNRAVDYRNADYRNNEDNRRLDYRANQQTQYLSNKQAAVFGGMYDPEEERRLDEEFEYGYRDAQIQDYNAQVDEYNRQLEEYYDDEEDDGYYADDYSAQPGYTDDCGVADYAQYLPEPQPQGGYTLDYVDDYVVDYGQPTSAPTAARERFVQVADGLGYYP